MESLTMDVVAEENQDECLGKIEIARGFCICVSSLFVTDYLLDRFLMFRY